MPRTAVQNARRSKDISQRGLADLIGATISFVSRYELGYCDASTDQRQRIAAVLSLPEQALLDQGLQRHTGAPSPSPSPAPSISFPSQPTTTLAPTPIVVVSAPTAAVVDYSRTPDLSQPKQFSLMPDRSVLETSSRDLLIDALHYTQAIVKTSGVPAITWAAWRGLEKEIRSRLAQLS